MGMIVHFFIGIILSFNLLTIGLKNQTLASNYATTLNIEPNDEIEAIIKKLIQDKKQTRLVNKEILDKAFAAVDNISKYPILLVYKGRYFLDNANDLLAEKYLLLANKYINAADNPSLKAECELYLGVTYNTMAQKSLSKEEFFKANQHYKKSIELYKKLENKEKIRTIERYKILNLYLKDPKNSTIVEELKNFSKDIHLFSEKNQPIDIFFALSMYLTPEINRLDLAEEFVTIKYKRLMKSDSIIPTFKSIYYMFCSEFYARKNERNLAIKHIDTSSYYLKKSNNLLDSYAAYENYSNIYGILGDTETQQIYKDSLNIVSKKINKQAQEASINLLDEQEKYRELVEQLKQNQLVKNIIIGIIVIVLLLILYFSRKTLKKLLLNNHQLSSEKKFLEENYQKLLSRYKITSEKLKSIKHFLQQTNKNNNDGAIKNVVNDLSIFISNDETLNLAYANKLQELVAFQLQKICPALSDVELHVCFLIKMNLTATEIGEILNKTKRSVEGIKYRIRKKLSEITTSSLEEILNSIQIDKLEDINLSE